MVCLTPTIDQSKMEFWVPVTSLHTTTQRFAFNFQFSISIFDVYDVRSSSAYPHIPCPLPTNTERHESNFIFAGISTYVIRSCTARFIVYLCGGVDEDIYTFPFYIFCFASISLNTHEPELCVKLLTFSTRSILPFHVKQCSRDIILFHLETMREAD